MTDVPSAAVIIPARNAATTIGAQLGALEPQTARLVEVIIADNGSSDLTTAIARDFGGMIRVIDASDGIGSAHARNVGAAACSADLLLFCDADDVVSATWVDSMCAALDDADLVGGRNDDELLNSDAVMAWRPPRASAALSTPEGFLPFAPSNNLGIHRRAWEQLGGMDEAYAIGHDVELSWRAQLQGLRLGFAPDAVVHYRYRATAWATLRQAFGTGSAAAQLYRGYREHGLRPRPLARGLRDWLWIVARVPMLARAETRGVWCRRFGEAAGRIRGSVRHRVRYL